MTRDTRTGERRDHLRIALLFVLMILVPLAAGLIGSALFFALTAFQDYIVNGRLAYETAGSFFHLLGLAVLLSCVSALYTILPAYIALQVLLRRTAWSIPRIVLVTSLVVALFAFLGPVVFELVEGLYRKRTIPSWEFWRTIFTTQAGIWLLAAVAHVISMFLATFLVLKFYGAAVSRRAGG